MFIAAGIGLHNFAEGLAIGQSAATGELTLAVLLVIGFALHNATEEFENIAPLSGEPERSSWRFLALAGTIGGGPTFDGTLVGRTFVNETLAIAFLALAGGSILYVITQLLRVTFKLEQNQLLAMSLLSPRRARPPPCRERLQPPSRRRACTPSRGRAPR